MGKRDLTIDIAKGITIILMLFGHFNSLWDTKFFYMIFSYHMPFFFFFSGYFYKEKPNSLVFKNGIQSLIKPYAITSLFVILLAFLFYSEEIACDHFYGSLIGCKGAWGPLISTKELSAGPIWFLLALFWCKLYYNSIYNFANQKSLIISIILTLFFWQFGYRIVNLPLCLGCAFTGLLFYSAGHEIKKFGINRIKFRWVIYIIWITAFMSTYLNMAQYIYTWFPLSMLGAICGSIAIYDLSSLIKGKLALFFSYAGLHTLDILCCHTIAWISKDFFLTVFGIPSSTLNVDLSWFISTICFYLIYDFIKDFVIVVNRNNSRR